MALELLKNLDDSRLSDLGKTGKTCSGCDPDVPGHVARSSCKTCKGTGQETCSFSRTATEIAKSKLSEESEKQFKGNNTSKSQPKEEDDDSSLYLEY